MNADTATPASPTTPTSPQTPGQVPVPGATTSPAGDLGHHGHIHREKNALMEWTQKAWEGLKHGKLGNPKILLLVVAVIAILAAWWFLADSSAKSESNLWSGFDTAGRPIAGETVEEGVKRIESFASDQSVKDSVAAPILRLDAIRLRMDSNMRKLTAEKVADRQAAADELAKVRDELVQAADWFPKDRSMKASTLLAAAKVEDALIGVPTKDAKPLDPYDQKSRGKVERYAELLKKAADAIGPTTPAGEDILAKAEKYAGKDAAEKLYQLMGEFHAAFNNPDPVARPTDPTDPFGGEEPFPGLPRRPTTLPEGPTDKPLGPGDAPKPPTKPLDPPN